MPCRGRRKRSLNRLRDLSIRRKEAALRKHVACDRLSQKFVGFGGRKGGSSRERVRASAPQPPFRTAPPSLHRRDLAAGRAVRRGQAALRGAVGPEETLPRAESLRKEHARADPPFHRRWRSRRSGCQDDPGWLW